MQSTNPRRTVINMTYNGKQLEESVEDFSYTDVSSGEGDTISIEIENIEKEWFNGLMPKKNDKIKVKIKTYNWKVDSDNWDAVETETLDCGTFLLDDFSFKGRPLTCSIKAISTPLDTGFKATAKTKTWENVSIKEVGEEIAKRAKVQLVYDADEIKIKTLEQSDETDSECIKKLCDEYGLYIKIYNDKIVIYDPSKYDQKGASLTLKETDMESWTWETSLDGTYTGGKMEYTDAKKEKDYKAKIGNGERILSINKKADSEEDARKKITGAVNIANRGTTKMTVNMMGNTDIVATSVVEVKDMGGMSGKYFVEKVEHTVNSNGYKTKLDLQKVEQKVT